MAAGISSSRSGQRFSLLHPRIGNECVAPIRQNRRRAFSSRKVRRSESVSARNVSSLWVLRDNADAPLFWLSWFSPVRRKNQPLYQAEFDDHLYPFAGPEPRIRLRGSEQSKSVNAPDRRQSFACHNSRGSRRIRWFSANRSRQSSSPKRKTDALPCHPEGTPPISTSRPTPRNSAAINSLLAGKNSNLGLPMGDLRSATLPPWGEVDGASSCFMMSSLTVPWLVETANTISLRR